MHSRPWTMTTYTESINSHLQRGQTFTTLTTLNTEQNQLALNYQRTTNTPATLVVKY